MQRTTCNMHLTTVVNMIRYAADNKQHDKQRQATRNNATDIPRHRGHLNRVAGAAAGESRHTRASRAATAHLFKHSVLRHAATAMPTAALRSYAHSTCAHAERVACAARTRCTHLHPRRTASMDAAVSGRTCWHPHRWLPAGWFARARAANAGWSTRTAFVPDPPQPPALASSPSPTQATACCRSGVLDKTLVATPVYELCIAGGLGVACASAGDGGVV